MVENGWALAYRYYSSQYIESENEARLLKRGMWQEILFIPELAQRKA